MLRKLKDRRGDPLRFAWVDGVLTGLDLAEAVQAEQMKTMLAGLEEVRAQAMDSLR